MRVYNLYLITVATTLLLTTVILVALEQIKLGVYYTLYVIEAFIITELFIHFNVKALRGLHLVSILLSCGFVLIVLLYIFEMLR